MLFRNVFKLIFYCFIFIALNNVHTTNNKCCLMSLVFKSLVTDAFISQQMAATVLLMIFHFSRSHMWLSPWNYMHCAWSLYIRDVKLISTLFLCVSCGVTVHLKTPRCFCTPLQFLVTCEYVCDSETKSQCHASECKAMDVFSVFLRSCERTLWHK